MTKILKEERNVAHREVKMKCNRDLGETGMGASRK
jgi:hypothetical protein